MKNNKPFEIILDSYASEAFQLFCIVRSLFDYPAIDDGSGDEDYEGKLYAAAFAYICSDYLAKYAGVYPLEDFGYFVDKMDFEADLVFLREYPEVQNIDGNTKNLNELVEILIESFRSKISKDIKTLFNSEKLQLSLFGAMFNMGEQHEFEPTSDTYFTTEFLK
jgi:hypothetical protein